MTNQEIGKLYDSFPKEQQDVSKTEFIKQVQSLADPKRMQTDLARIMHGKQNKQIIDGAMG